MLNAFALPAGIQSWGNDASSPVQGTLPDTMDLDDAGGTDKKFAIDGQEYISWQDLEINFDCDLMSKSSTFSSDVSITPPEAASGHSALIEAEACPWQSIPAGSEHLACLPNDRLDILAEPTTNTCADCRLHFGRYQELEKHARDSGHASFWCHFCYKRYARRDTLQRHVAKHRDPKLHCQWCKKSFTRKDHMKLHLGRCAQRPPTNDLPGRRPSVSTASSLEDFDPFGGMLKHDELLQLYHQLNALNDSERQCVCQDILKTVGEAHANRRESIRSS